jgi:adenine phosphoribosyltransferase
MKRDDFHKFFKTPGPVVLPVIHVLDNAQTEHNVRIALAEGTQGVFLINHDFPYPQFLPIIKHIRARFPTLWLGVNFLAVTGKQAFPVLAELAREGCRVDAYWGDDARIDENLDVAQQAEARDIRQIEIECGWHGMYFGGTAFKKQRIVAADKYEQAAAIAMHFMDVVTTSGIATGQAVGISKINDMRRGCGDTALALASGITPANAAHYAPAVDAFMVATGVNMDGDFYHIDALKLRRLLALSRSAALPDCDDGGEDDRSRRWYLANMAPNIKGGTFAWLDPSAMYVNARSFHALLDDLSEPFSTDSIDVVAGIDAMGFALGSALAARLGTGFLTLRKAGKLPVVADSVQFTNYSGKSQSMELRQPAFATGTRVLLVDQWIETGGTMDAAIRLIERQGGVVAGIACVCIEENAATNIMRERYRCSTAVLPGTELQRQCNSQKLESFDDFTEEQIFP